MDWFDPHQSLEHCLSLSQMANPFLVVNPSYCAPHTINLQINAETSTTYDANNLRRFYIKDTLLTLHHRRVLYDNEGNPVLTLYKKIPTMHGRYQVFEGESSDSSKLLFSVKRSSILASGLITLDIFLARNKKEKVRDFRVNLSSRKNSCTVYAGESPKVLATMVNNCGFNVLINPNADYAFIVALLLIIKDMKFYYDGMVNFATRATPIAVGTMASIN